MSLSELDELMREASTLGYTPRAIELYERAVDVADAQKDPHLGFRARKRLMEVATFGGSVEKAIVAFAWCLKKVDDHPDEFSESSIIWEYKWMLLNAIEFPEISLKRIEAMYDDFEKRLVRRGDSLRTFYSLREDLARSRWDSLDVRRAWLEKSRAIPRGSQDNCLACEVRDHASQELVFGSLDEALRIAQPIFERRLTCTTVPHTAYSHFLLPLLRAGEEKKAKGFHATGYELTKTNRLFLQTVARHLVFDAEIGELDVAVERLGRHLPWVLTNHSAAEQMVFFAAARHVLRTCAANGRSEVQLRIPKELSYSRAEGSVRELLAFFDERTLQIARRFDARNGHSKESEYMAQWPKRDDH